MGTFNYLDVIIRQKCASTKQYRKTRDRINKYLHDEDIALTMQEKEIIEEWSTNEARCHYGCC